MYINNLENVHYIEFLLMLILQMTDMRFMEDINNILYSGEVPNIFTVDEKLEIIENMRNLEKQLDKSQQTDGSGTGK